MNNLISYIYSILMFVILIVILEMLIPEGSNKKYVKLVSGFILMFIIILPVMSLFTSANNIEDKIYNNILGYDLIYDNANELMTSQDKFVENIFVEGLKNDVSKIVSENGYVADHIQIGYDTSINEGKKKFGAITKVTFKIISKINNNADLANKNIEPVSNIEQIDMNSNNYEKDDNKFNINEEDKEKIITKIADRYQMDKTNINIL